MTSHINKNNSLEETFTLTQKDLNFLRLTVNEIEQMLYNDGSVMNELPSMTVAQLRETSDEQLLTFINNIHNVYKKMFVIIILLQQRDSNEKIYKIQQSHWDILKRKCENDPMVSELWNDLMILLKLEE